MAGIEIPYELGLKGHSDADVISHALIDSIFGALALGDIGSHFPDNDNKYKDISSIKLLEETIKLMEEKEYIIYGNDDIEMYLKNNADITYEYDGVEKVKYNTKKGALLGALSY